MFPSPHLTITPILQQVLRQGSSPKELNELWETMDTFCPAPTSLEQHNWDLLLRGGAESPLLLIEEGWRTHHSLFSGGGLFFRLPPSAARG